jgi:bacterial/archaeal transporter family protein
MFFMSVADWFLPSMVALLLWGGSIFLPKLAVRTLPPLHLAVYSSAFFMLGAVGMLAFYGFELEFDAAGIALAMIIGILGAVAQLMYIFAIRAAPVTYVTVITALYPVVATLLAFILLDEKLTARQAAGILLGICAVILMVAGARDDQTKA